MRLAEGKQLQTNRQFHSKLEALKKQIEGKKMLLNKDWLLQRVIELK